MKMNRRERYVLSAGVVAALLVVLTGWIILPFFESKKDLADEINNKRRKLETYQAFVQRKEEFLKELQALQTEKKRLQARILMVNNSGEAEAQLREALNQYSQANGVSITRSNVLLEEKLKNGYSKIAIDFNVNSDIGPLTRFLYALASNPTFIEIRQVNINAYMNKNQVVLQPRITLAALVRKG